jgi:hypothetical protein
MKPFVIVHKTDKVFNFLFCSESTNLQSLGKTVVPIAPSQKEIDAIFERINRGEDVSPLTGLTCQARTMLRCLERVIQGTAKVTQWTERVVQ